MKDWPHSESDDGEDNGREEAVLDREEWVLDMEHSETDLLLAAAPGLVPVDGLDSESSLRRRDLLTRCSWSFCTAARLSSPSKL